MPRNRYVSRPVSSAFRLAQSEAHRSLRRSDRGNRKGGERCAFAIDSAPANGNAKFIFGILHKTASLPSPGSFRTKIDTRYAFSDQPCVCSRDLDLETRPRWEKCSASLARFLPMRSLHTLNSASRSSQAKLPSLEFMQRHCSLSEKERDWEFSSLFTLADLTRRRSEPR